ncbi:MAG: Cas9 inhibitor AcrIIA9 family protein [Lachnospiraceae bacterium]|nr:Cas9 inhibitor AcrIIA9 family protein [Lachnospiraceae bacterium]
MYEIFGEFDSAEELNLCAAGLKAERDKDNLLILAKENGIDESLATMYLEGTTQTFIDIFGAMCGKLEVERKEGKTGIAPAQAIIDYLSITGFEKEELAIAIRRKGKSLEKCCEEITKAAKEIAAPEIEKEIQKRRQGNQKPTNAPGSFGQQTVNIPDLTVFKMAETYYLRQEDISNDNSIQSV